MFLHHIADASDIISEYTKFGYNDHIKLAKKIIDFGSSQSKCYVMNNYCKIKTLLPNIKNLYFKDNTNFTKTTKNNKVHHLRQNSNSSNNSTANNSINKSNNRTISQSPTKKENSKNDSPKSNKKANEKIIINNTLNINRNSNDNNINFSSFKHENKSIFINNNEYNNENNNDHGYASKNISKIINGLLKRNLFFGKFNKYNNVPSLEELEINYCSKIYEKTNDSEIKLLLEKKF